MSTDGMTAFVSDDCFTVVSRRADEALHKRGIVPLLRLDHAAAARVAGLELRPLLLLVFGDPKVGTPLMQENPTAGIDLPLKLLVWEDSSGRTWVGYTDPEWIRARHGLSEIPVIARMTTLLDALARSAAGHVSD